MRIVGRIRFEFEKAMRQKAFTLIELLVVIAIISRR
ncbi:MAG: prepilin-type N-terminal cleavage/methylation domain-containing protein [Planctomycetota bacterium]